MTEPKSPTDLLALYMEDLSAHTEVDEPRAVELAEAARSGDDEAGVELAYGLMARVPRIVERIQSDKPPLDLIQEGNEGMLSAITSWDSSAPFLAYVDGEIEEAVLAEA